MRCGSRDHQGSLVRFIINNGRGGSGGERGGERENPWHTLHLQRFPFPSFPLKGLTRVKRQTAKHAFARRSGRMITANAHLLSAVLLEDGGGAALARRRSRRRRRHGASAARRLLIAGCGAERRRQGDDDDDDGGEEVVEQSRARAGGRFFLFIFLKKIFLTTFAPQCPSSEANRSVSRGTRLHHRLLHPERSPAVVGEVVSVVGVYREGCILYSPRAGWVVLFFFLFLAAGAAVT